MRAHVLLLDIALTIATPNFATAAQDSSQGEQEREQEEGHPPAGDEIPQFSETVVVTASRVEQQLLNSPAAVSVVGAETLESTPSRNFGDLLRSLPGLNVIQTSARDINLTSRGATKTTANTQIALLDGRSIYQDFLGFVLWDAIPIQTNEIKQIEVIRGPAGAVWGPNAMDGVVNILTKTPREMTGTSVTLGAGVFDRKVEGSDLDTGAIYYAAATHAAAVDQHWAYKFSTGFFSQDALPRPTGTIPNVFQTPYPLFPNTGTTQPKVDARVDYDFADGRRKIVIAGGVSGVDGVLHTGSGPFDIQSGSVIGYGKVNFTQGNLKLNFFLNVSDGDASSLLSQDALGQAIPLVFKSQTYDVEFSNSLFLDARHVITYGGNFRRSNFDLSVAPLGRNRTEGGAYVQDQIFLNDRFQLILGGRVDKLGIIDRLAFSPRASLIAKLLPQHALRVSFNRAFRAPTLINNYLDLTLASTIDLGLVDPSLAGQAYAFPVKALGNVNLEAESLNAYEVGYTGIWGNRASVGAAYYFNDRRKNVLFSQTGSYSSDNLPPNWPLPGFVLDLLIEAGAGLPSELMDINVGRVKEQGIELSVEMSIHQALDVFANYSWQKTPSAEGLTLAEINLPPNHRFNAGLGFDRARYYGSVTFNYVDDAFWQDVLDVRFHGPTESYAMVHAGLGIRWADGKMTAFVKATNLTNREVQQHVFGDIVKRQVSGELRFSF